MIFKFGSCAVMILFIFAAAPVATALQENSQGSESEESKPVIPPSFPEPPLMEPVPTPPDPQLAPDMIIISGRVIRDDGSPPPFGTVVERDCGGVVIKEALVDTNGNFNFVVGDSNRASSLFPDATENFSSDRSVIGGTDAYSQRNQQRMMKRNYPEDLALCVVQARYAGYQSTIARLGFGQTSGYIEVGTIVIYPVTRADRTVVSTADLAVPGSARNALEKGQKAFEENEFDRAEEYYLSAIDIYPQYSEAWIELGWLYQSRDYYQEARNAYMEALELDRLSVNPHLRLAQLSALEMNWEEAEAYSDEVLKLNPASYPEAYFINALARYNLDRLDSAEQIVRKGIRLDQENRVPKLHLVLANILAKKSDPHGSMDAMRRYLEIEPEGSEADRIRSLVKEYEKIAEKLPLTPSGE